MFVYKRGLLAIFLVILLGAMTACGHNEKLVEIDLGHVEKDVVKVEDRENVEPLRVAIAAVISAKESTIYYEDLINYLGEALNRPIELVHRKTYGEVNDLLRIGQVDLAFVCTYAYTLGKEEFGLELLAVPKVEGKPTYQNYIIVPQNSPAESLADLQGTRFAFTDPLSFTGRLYPVYLIKQLGYTPEAFFSDVIYTYSHDNSIKAVAKNVVDGAAVDSLILKYFFTIDPSYQDKVKVIRESEDFGMPPVVVPPDINSQLKEQLRELFLSLHLNNKNKALLDKLLIEKFVVPEDANYDSIREIANKVIDHGQ